VWGADRNILGRRDELAQLAIAAARYISRELGYVEPAQPQPAAAKPAALVDA